MSYYRGRTGQNSVRIPVSQLYVGMSIHLTGPHFGCVWQITTIESQNEKDETWLWAKTPVTGKYVHANAARALYVRSDEPGR
jgi:hypothetical protein